MTSELLRVLPVWDLVNVCISYLKGTIPLHFWAFRRAAHDRDDYYKTCFFDRIGRHSAYLNGVICASFSLHDTPKEYSTDPFNHHKRWYLWPWRRAAFHNGFCLYKTWVQSS